MEYFFKRKKWTEKRTERDQEMPGDGGALGMQMLSEAGPTSNEETGTTGRGCKPVETTVAPAASRL